MTLARSRAPVTHGAVALARARAVRRGIYIALRERMENHKLSPREQQDNEDPGIETDPLPHHAHQEVDLDEDEEIEEARMSSDDLMALDEDDLVYADGPDA